MLTAVPMGVAMARLVPTATTMTQGSGLIPRDIAMGMTTGVIIAATPLFCMKRVRAEHSRQITAVTTGIEAF